MKAARLLFILLLPALAAAATLDRHSYEVLQTVRQAMAAGKLHFADARLQKLLRGLGKNSYAFAVAQQTLGYLRSAQQRPGEAVAAFNAALAAGKLPPAVAQTLRYNIARLQAIQGKWRQAAKSYQSWLSREKAPSAQSYVFGAQIYSRLEQYDQAVAMARKAIALAKKPHEAWYQLLAALHYKRRDYKALARVLARMVELWPRQKDYWKQLASANYLLGHKGKALAVMALAYRQGFLQSESELLNLVNLYLQQNIPYKAARLMKREMAAGRIRSSAAHQQRLGELWMQARESRLALKTLLRAAKARRSGQLELRLARLLYDHERWSEVIAHTRRARLLGGLSSPGDAWLLEGMAQVELGRHKSARVAFIKAERYRQTAGQARQWLAWLDAG